MVEADLPLTVALGLEPASPGDGTFTRESLADVVEALRRALRGMPALRLIDLGPGVARELTRVLRTPLSGIAVSAWNKRKEISKYGDTTRYPSGETYEVWLHEHQVKQTIKPTVEVRLGGASVARLVFAATVTATLHGAMLVIRGGRITHIRLGDVNTSMQLSLGGAELIKRDLKRWALPGEVALGGGIPLKG